MEIKGTKKIRGVLALPSVKLELKSGHAYNVSETDFWNQDIQIALRMGFITKGKDDHDAGQTVPKNVDPDSDDDSVAANIEGNAMIKCKNIHKRSITLNQIQTEIKPGQIFVVRKKDLELADIKLAVSKRYIEIVEAVDADKEVTESSIRINDLLNMDDEVQEPSMADDMFQPDAKTVVGEKLDAMKGATVGKSAELDLDTNEEASNPRVIHDENPPPIRSNQIPDSRKNKNVIWNPTKGDVINRMKSVTMPVHGKQSTNIDDDAKDKIESAVNSIKSKIGVAKAPKIAKSHTPDPLGKSVVVQPADDEISFVDQEQAAQKIKDHPVLSKKEPVTQNDEIDFL